MAALAELLAADGLITAEPSSPVGLHFAPKAKSVIFMFMEGGPSPYELFDPKPELKRWDGQSLPESITKDLTLAFIEPTAKLMASRYAFGPRRNSGMELSELVPYWGSLADDICLVRSMHGDALNHHPGQLLLFTGSTLPGRPSDRLRTENAEPYPHYAHSAQNTARVVRVSGHYTSSGRDSATTQRPPGSWGVSPDGDRLPCCRASRACRPRRWRGFSG